MFGRHIRFDLLFAWLTWCPTTGFFPQTEQILAMGRSLLLIKKRISAA